MKTVLVTGGAGFIGSNFVRYLLVHPDWEIVNLDKLTYAGSPENLADVAQHPRYRFVRGDIADRELLDGLFAAHRFDLVANLAGRVRSTTSAPARRKPTWSWPARSLHYSASRKVSLLLSGTAPATTAATP